MPVEKYHKIIVIGNAMMYRTAFVKLKSRKILPSTPHTREAIFNAIHLSESVCCFRLCPSIQRNSPVGVVKTRRIILLGRTRICDIHPPCGDQGGDRHDIGHWPRGCGNEGNSGRSEPPVSISHISDAYHISVFHGTNCGSSSSSGRSLKWPKVGTCCSFFPV